LTTGTSRVPIWSDRLWLLTPDELETLPRDAEASVMTIESVMGVTVTLPEGTCLPDGAVTDVRTIRFPDGLALALTSWGIRGSELSRLNAELGD
jgi:hypothetical protein